MTRAPVVRPIEGGVEISVRAQPRAGRSEVAGPYGDRAVKLRLAAPPVDGAANEELIAFLSDLFGVAKSSVELVRGHGGRSKTVRVWGPDAGEARRRLGL